MSIAIICFPVDVTVNFEINHGLFYHAIFLHDQKNQNKNLNVSRTESAFNVK